MRLDTAEKRAAYRARMIPKGAERDARSGEAGEAFSYRSETLGHLYAIGFWGSAGNPTFHFRFRTEEQRENHLAKFFAGIQSHAHSVAERRDSAKAFRHDVKVGDIFRASWGYDQTNIDYYEVVALIGQCYAEVREIDQEAEETGFMQGKCVPTPGKWATEPDGSEAGRAYKAEHGHYPRVEKASRRVKIQDASGGEACFRVASYCHAYRIKPVAEIGKAKVYASSHWTAYA